MQQKIVKEKYCQFIGCCMPDTPLVKGEYKYHGECRYEATLYVGRIRSKRIRNKAGYKRSYHERQAPPLSKDLLYLINNTTVYTHIPLNNAKIIGVYWLIFNDKVVYVGKSKDIYLRIFMHKLQRKRRKTDNEKISFDSFAYIEYTISGLTVLELQIYKHFGIKYGK